MNGAAGHPVDARIGVRELRPEFNHHQTTFFDASFLFGKEASSDTQEGNGHAKTASVRIVRWKRVLDLTCVLLGLPVLLTVMSLVALWVKLVSPGPVFFRQKRVGYLGQCFFLWKFRSMKVNVETQTHERYLEQLIQTECPMTKLDVSGDPRLIFGGRVLRAMGLDELPQIFNVLRGEMSLVGPRPCTPYEFSRYEAWHRKRVLAPPGLTGYWQVNGKNQVTFREMVEMDIFYAGHMSLRLDLAIMLKTIPALVAQQFVSQTGAGIKNGANSR